MTAARLLLCFLSCLVSSSRGSHEYCNDPTWGSQRLFCLGIDDRQVMYFGNGYGCLYQPSCAIIVSGRMMYRNSTWFKVYVPVEEEAERLDIWFLLTKQEVSVSSQSRLESVVQRTMIAKGEQRVGPTPSLEVYSYRVPTTGRKEMTSSSFFSFAPDKGSTRLRVSIGDQNYTLFSWRASEYLTEGDETYNFIKTPVQLTMRVAWLTATEETVATAQTVRHLLFDDPRRQKPEGYMSVKISSRNDPRDEV